MDGAGAAVLEVNQDDDAGIKSHLSASYTLEEKTICILENLTTTKDARIPDTLRWMVVKYMNLFLVNVPDAMKKCLDNSGYSIDQLNKIIIHQANEKWMKPSLTGFISCMENRFRKISCLWLFIN